MCKYCESNKPISERELAKDRLTYEGIEMDIFGNELQIYAVGEYQKGTHIYGHYEKTIIINYCPMCGRKLN